MCWRWQSRVETHQECFWMWPCWLRVCGAPAGPHTPSVLGQAPTVFVCSVHEGLRLCWSLHWPLVSWHTPLLTGCKTVTQSCSRLMPMGTVSTVISRWVENPRSLLTALLPNIVLSFPALAQLTRSIKIGWHLEPLKEKKKKISGIPELLIQKNLARISKARSTRAAGLVPVGHWLVPEK